MKKETKENIGFFAMVIITNGIFLGGIGSCAYYMDKSSKESRAEQKQHEQNIIDSMPTGCVLHEYGRFRGVDNLIVVTCDKGKTTSQNYIERHGKRYDQTTTVEIDP